ncbi:MAG: winged helix-turn-helix transcriptional regulator [Elusimicrobia bacterium]|nr:winged helix-turn-helix transcriptional regulator [Elusimicrobiota bacterium]
MKDLAAKEFSLIQEIAKSPTRSQRDLSHSIGLSLGTTNLLIKRLARKGLIKVKSLDLNRMQYLLTIKGAVEKSRKSYDYSLYTIRIFRQIRENIQVAFRREYERGEREIVIVAQDEILELVRETVQELNLQDLRPVYVRSFAEVPEHSRVIFNAVPEPCPPQRNGERNILLVDFNDIDFRLS